MPSVPENNPVLQRQPSQKEVEISAASLAVHHNARQNLQVHLRKIPLLANLTDEEIIKVKAEFTDTPIHQARSSVAKRREWRRLIVFTRRAIASDWTSPKMVVQLACAC